MKYLKIICIFLFFFLLGFYFIYNLHLNKPIVRKISIKNIFTGSKFSLLDSPSMSLKAKVTDFSGEIFLKNRIGDNFERIYSSLNTLLQGETVKTGDDGYLIMSYDNVAKINMNKNSTLDIIQTLPNNLVFSQIEGNINYQKISDIPVSVRSKRLLVEILGEVNILIDGDIVRISGDAKIAYNNTANITKVIEVPKSKTLIFNNQNLKVVSK